MTQAKVEMIDGQLVLNDPVALGVIQAVAKHNCKGTYEAQKDRVAHFVTRMTARGLTSQDVVIVLLNVDDTHGGPLADILMPGFNWDEIRARGEIPFARGLASREGIQAGLADLDKDAAEKLSRATGIAVVVADHGVFEVFDV